MALTDKLNYKIGEITSDNVGAIKGTILGINITNIKGAFLLENELNIIAKGGNYLRLKNLSDGSNVANTTVNVCIFY